MNDLKNWLTVKEAAEAFNYSPKYLQAMAKRVCESDNPKFVCIKKGWMYLIERKSFEAHVQRIAESPYGRKFRNL